MSSTSDYNELLPEIQAIRPEDTVTPITPVDVYVYEAENLYHWCLDDQTALQGAGLDWTLVLRLPVRVGACREAQSLWIRERNMRERAEQDWIEQSPGVFLLRDLLVHTFRYAFRRHEGLLSQVEKIAKSDTNSDLVKDLNDLSALGRTNADLLKAVGFDLKLLDTAAILSDQMDDLLGTTNGEREKDNEAMIIRDKAFTYLKLAVDEIRECGKYVFWRNSDRLEGYLSDYSKRKRTPTVKMTTETHA